MKSLIKSQYLNYWGVFYIDEYITPKTFFWDLIKRQIHDLDLLSPGNLMPWIFWRHCRILKVEITADDFLELTSPIDASVSVHCTFNRNSFHPKLQFTCEIKKTIVCICQIPLQYVIRQIQLKQKVKKKQLAQVDIQTSKL